MTRSLPFALLLLTPALAWGSVALRLSVEQLTEKAAVVVHGTVMEQHTVKTRGGRIVTTSQIAVAESFKGSAGPTIVVRTQGGVIGEIGQQVSGEAHFKLGEEVVVFLRPTGLSDASYAVLGLAQGKFTVSTRAGEDVATQNLEGLDTVRSPGQPIEEAQALSLSVAELKARVSQAVTR